MNQPRVSVPGGERQMLMQFGGYNHTPLCREGEWYDDENLSSEYAPILSTRKNYELVAEAREQEGGYHGIAAKDKLVVVDGTNVIYGTNTVNMSGLITDSGPKQLVSMGAYLLIWPDKAYLNVHDFTDKGSIENTFTNPGTGSADPAVKLNYRVTVSICDRDGNNYGSTTTSDVAPLNPADGDYWIDISNTEVPLLKQWNDGTGMWVTIPNTCVKIKSTWTANNVTHKISDGFSRYDSVNISGLSYSNTYPGWKNINGAHTIYALGEDSDGAWIAVEGIISRSGTLWWYNGITVKRAAPDMDYITECDNRIWGCKYGMVDGKPVNEIYACALGDFKNWNKFQGLSTDSYAAGRGADGAFTGAITYQGHPLFFRENCIEKVYPSASGAHQIVTTEARGVQEGCWRSLAIVGETLYYKSRKDVCAYTGSLPMSVGQALGDTSYINARAGAVGAMYYIAMEDGASGTITLVYDTSKNIWHRSYNNSATEPDTEILAEQYAELGGVLYWYRADGKLFRITDNPLQGRSWEATSGPIGLDLAENEYITRFVIRCETTGTVFLWIRYDEETETVNGVTREKWHAKGTHTCTGLGSFVLPVAPKRCDHLRIRIAGTAACRIYSIAKYVESGSDQMW